MKKILLFILALSLLLVSCSSDISFVLNEDGTLIMNEETLYPLPNSYRYTDYGITEKLGDIEIGEVFAVNSSETILYVSS